MTDGNKQIYFFILSTLILLCGAENMGAQGTIAQQPGEFYTDYTTTDGGQNIQKTNTYRTTIYVKPSTNKTLSIPTTGNSAPHSYVRWYDFKTNGVPANTTGGVRYTNGFSGSWTYNRTWTYAMQNTVTYNSSSPSGSIACDVSAYTDYEYTTNGTRTQYFTTEPTLSYRWIFDIKSAHEIAGNLKKLASNAYLEEKTVNLPTTKLSGTLSGADGYPRVTLDYNVDDYWGYSSASATANSNLVNGTLKVYGDGTLNNGVNLSGRFIRIDPSKKLKEVTVTLTCSQQVYRVARFKLNYVEDPMKFENLPNERKSDFFKKNYIELSKLDFDDDTKPATIANNCRLIPLDWDYCSYGFASASLRLKGYRDMSDGCAASQNEYGFYKTANVTGISKKGMTYSNVTITDPKGTSRTGSYSYNWWNGDNEAVHDRRYYDTNGKEAGYFMYIDASNQPGIVAKLRVDGTFCSDTKLIVSAGICNMSNGATNSDADLNFIFKAVDAVTGKEYELYRYTSGDIPKYTGNSSGEEPWYQIYFSFSYEKPEDGITYDYFMLQVDNNASSTYGGDYAIDDIHVYRSKPSVQANQILLSCGTEESAKIKIQIGYEKLLSMLALSPSETEVEINYQFMDEDKVAITGYNYHQGATSATSPFEKYGSIWIKTEKKNMTEWAEDNSDDRNFGSLPVATGDKVFANIEHIENDPQGQYDYIVFRTPNNDVLKYNYTYYTAVADRSGSFATDICALISDPFIIEKPAMITVDGAAVIDGKGICYGSPITMKAVLLDRINHEPIDPCSFDWYFGSGFAEISGALSRYRDEEAHPGSVGDTGTALQQPKGPFTQEDYDILEDAIDTHKLYLNRTEVTRRVLKGEIALAKPIEASTGKKDNPDFNICNDVIQLDTSGESAMPDVEIGEGVKTQVVRMDQEQASSLIGNQAYTLWIPVIDFKNSDGNKTYEIVQSKDNLYDDAKTGIVYLSGTNDPAYKGIDFRSELLPRIARLNTIQVGPDADRYLVFSFNGKDTDYPATANGFSMREGFTYSLLFFFNEENNASGTVTYSVCNGMTNLSVCVVPQYLTWTGAAGDNWNNDGNWHRSTKEELYKEDYIDYTGEDLTQAQGFVPMHHSLATIANTTPAPWLYELTDHDYKANAPTKEIEYELEVWKGTDVAIESAEARKHTYAGALFKGNSCSQIYFKHGAEMRNTQYLTYDKAHVEFELTNNRWYMLSSPLQGVVAGDMYIPTAEGRQVTEAFKDITYQQGTINNRFDPAVYQRNWSTDNAENFCPQTGSYNVRKVGDWSGTYNRVDEIYNAGRGFSIRPIYFETVTGGAKEIKEGHQTLFRLPKADTRYEYYAYGSDEILDSGKGWDANSDRLTANGRLALTPGTGQVSATLTNNHGGNGELFLAGNPFMATLDINKFISAHQSDNDQNRQLQWEYILLTEQGQCYFKWNEEAQSWESSVAGTTGGTVAPLQGFFVKRKVRGAQIEVIYTPEMTVAKPAAQSLLRSAGTRSADDGAARLYVTAERDGFKSHILIAKQFSADNDYNEEEDVPTFIDSNLKDQPTLYSVAGNTVVSINKVSDRKLIPIGVYSEKEEDVTLSFSGAGNFGEKLALYDAQTGSTTTISDGPATFSIPGNTYGRYFIRLGETEGEEFASVVTAYSPDANRLVITASQGNPLKRVRIYNTLGMAIKDLTNLNSSREEVTLPAGLYIVRVESEKENATMKVIVN